MCCTQRLYDRTPHPGGSAAAAGHKQLSNLDLQRRCDGLEYDPENEYSIPYFWGTVGIVYDKNKVSEEACRRGLQYLPGYELQGSIYLYDSDGDSFMMALKALGYSMNTSDENDSMKL